MTQMTKNNNKDVCQINQWTFLITFPTFSTLKNIGVNPIKIFILIRVLNSLMVCYLKMHKVMGCQE